MKSDRSDNANNANSVNDDNPENVDHAVGRAVKSFRSSQQLSIRQLSERCGVSAAMLSRIENGQVSPSLASLTAIANALEIPLVSLFRHTSDVKDITYVQQGVGLTATRTATNHQHEFQLLGYHRRDDMRFEPVLVTLHQSAQNEHPSYQGHGCEFIYLLEGEGIYRCGDTEYTLTPGDSLSLDYSIDHGFARLQTPVVRYLAVLAQPL